MPYISAEFISEVPQGMLDKAIELRRGSNRWMLYKHPKNTPLMQGGETPDTLLEAMKLYHGDHKYNIYMQPGAYDLALPAWLATNAARTFLHVHGQEKSVTDPKRWYTGAVITQQQLFMPTPESPGLFQGGDVYLAFRMHTALATQDLQLELINELGLDGAPEYGQGDHRWFYIFLKGAHTRPAHK